MARLKNEGCHVLMGRHTTTVTVPCPRCGAPATCAYVAQTRHGELRAHESLQCPACGLAQEVDGDALGTSARDAFYAAEGRWSAVLRDLGPRRLESLRVLRSLVQGSPAELKRMMDSQRALVDGTLAEVERVTDMLVDVGAEVSISQKHVKISFELDQDEDGYPPVASEGVWAYAIATGEYVLDNIPFFVHVATLGDVVRATGLPDGLSFEAVTTRSDNSLLRVVPLERDRLEELRSALSRLGCDTEWSGVHNIVSVNVPGSVNLASVQTYLQTAAREGWLDYKEPLLRQ